MRNKVLIYEDYGCADISVLAKELRTYFEPRGCKVGFTNANEIISRNSLNQEVLAFFIPGGASTPYRHKLEILGNAKIREYVQQGGVYYGICAGAYYACKHTEFEKDLPESQIIAEYKLDLLNAKAIGSLYKELNIKPFAKNTASSAAVELLDEKGDIVVAHYHGGPYFELNNPANAEILARYNLAGFKPAVVLQPYGKGKVILSGVHYEDSAQALKAVSNSADTLNRLQQNETVRRHFFEKLMSLSGR